MGDLRHLFVILLIVCVSVRNQAKAPVDSVKACEVGGGEAVGVPEDVFHFFKSHSFCFRNLMGKAG